MHSINSDKISLETFCYKKANIELHTTLYRSTQKTTRAVILYFHGGGLLYGRREDLPEYHINEFCNAGYSILAFDYRLAPSTKLPGILDDVRDAITWYLGNRTQLFDYKCPYFLWGRSAGAYLCLMAGKMDMQEKPLGILSYYGYTFINDSWYNQPNQFYTQFPAVDIKTINSLCSEGETAEGLLDTRYSMYIYARQTGKWISMIIDNSVEDFYDLYTFKRVTDFSNYPPVLLAHSFHDTDVPFAESQALSSRLPKTRFVTAFAKAHDFDRDTKSDDAVSLIEESIDFMNELTSK